MENGIHRIFYNISIKHIVVWTFLVVSVYSRSGLGYINWQSLPIPIYIKFIKTVVVVTKSCNQKT